MGLRLEGVTPQAFQLWPGNVHAFQVFRRLCTTQWRRAGMAGMVCALDYSQVPFLLQMEQIPQHRWPAVWDGLEEMEIAALKLFRERVQRD